MVSGNYQEVLQALKAQMIAEANGFDSPAAYQAHMAEREAEVARRVSLSEQRHTAHVRRIEYWRYRGPQLEAAAAELGITLI